MSPSPSVITVPKRSVVIGGRKSSVSIEDGFWHAFKNIADERKMTVSNLATYINARRDQKNLSSAIRLFVLEYYVDQISRKERKYRKQPPSTIARVTADKLAAQGALEQIPRHAAVEAKSSATR